jgi:hypothetical protein
VSPTADSKSLLLQTTRTSRVLPPELGLIVLSILQAVNENARIMVRNSGLMILFFLQRYEKKGKSQKNLTVSFFFRIFAGREIIDSSYGK